MRLYAYIERAGGPQGLWPVSGATEIANKIGMQPTTLLGHARHLAQAGLIEYHRDGQKEFAFHIVHNPARSVYNDFARIPPPRPRARKTSKYAPNVRNCEPREAQFSQVRTFDNRVSRMEERPSKIVGQPKSAVKYAESVSATRVFEATPFELCAYPGCSELYDGHTFCDHEPVHQPAATNLWELLDVGGLTDEEIGLFPADKEEPLTTEVGESARARSSQRTDRSPKGLAPTPEVGTTPSRSLD